MAKNGPVQMLKFWLDKLNSKLTDVKYLFGLCAKTSSTQKEMSGPGDVIRWNPKS